MVLTAVRDGADEVLRRLVGRADARFRPDQYEAVEALLEGRRTLVVQRTGWGKSAVYFVTTALARARGSGPALIVSPLLALMRDQVAAAERAGVRARTVNSGNLEEWTQVEADLAAGAVDVLLVSPERLNNPDFRDRWLPALVGTVGLLVVDEAHCISDWGHDFRPDYRRIRDLLARLPVTTPVLATTATANARVVADVVEELGAGAAGDVTVLRGPLERESLRLAVVPLPTPAHRLAWLATHLPALPGSGIVYTLTVAAAEEVAAHLREAGLDVRAYTGRTDPAERLGAERALLAGEVKALVATSALGMGFDKPDLGFVVHLGAPQSPIAYYQQVGRAGRAVESAEVVLLPGSEDVDIWRYFAALGVPDEPRVRAVLDALAEAGRPLSTAALEARVDLRRTRLELLLKVLDVDGAVRRVRGGWLATGQPWTHDGERYARVAAARQQEQEAMLSYLTTEGCRMEFLRRELDDPWSAPCGRCDRCAGPVVPLQVSAAAVDAARGVLVRPGVEVEPRTLWPSAVDRLGVEVSGRIAAAERALPGRAVARLSDLGWGTRLRTLLAADTPDAPPPGDLVRAVVDVLRHWDWEQRPAAVVSVPSRSHPLLVAGLAAAVAGIGRLPDLGALDLVDGGPTGSRGGNSAFRLAGVWDRLAVSPELAATLPGGVPVLLVDDRADSRWTLTVATRALRRAGAAGVLPLVLALEG